MLDLKRTKATTSLPLAAALVALLACTPEYTIVEDAPTTVEVGGQYFHVFKASKQDEKNTFSSCSNKGVVIDESGTLSFFPESPGTVTICVALAHDGKRIDTYEYDVVIEDESTASGDRGEPATPR